ncbi:MAG TPA: DUF3313 domain-containing protein [Sphingomicrobium sp.]|nr:DUF3313 domain-containing protein [Sphingomicrobium sp.]
MRYRSAAALLLLASTGAFSQTSEHAPVSLSSSQRMSQDEPRSESWTYMSPKFRASRFSGVCVLPTKIYNGPDAQFPGTSGPDKQRYANILTQQVTAELAKAFPVYPQRRPGCLTMQMSLVGLEDTKGGVATATRVMPVGFALSTVKSLTGKKGSFTGSMLVSFEFSGGKGNEILVAAVRRRAPDALDIPATLSMTDTVKAVGRDFGRELRDRLTASGVVSRR